MCGVVRWWVGQGLTGNDVGRQRDTEFVATRRRQRRHQLLGHAARTIADVISETRSPSPEEILTDLDPAALTQQSAVDTLGPQLNRWALVHTIDELSQHIGHMELTIQLHNARSPRDQVELKPLNLERESKGRAGVGPPIPLPQWLEPSIELEA